MVVAGVGPRVVQAAVAASVRSSSLDMPVRHPTAAARELLARSVSADHSPGSSESAEILPSSFAASSAPGSGFFCSVMFGQVDALAIASASGAGSLELSMSAAALAPDTTALMSLYTDHFAGSSL